MVDCEFVRAPQYPLPNNYYCLYILETPLRFAKLHHMLCDLGIHGHHQQRQFLLFQVRENTHPFQDINGYMQVFLGMDLKLDGLL